MKNQALIFGGIAAVAIIGGAMWYNKNKKAGTLPKWLSADGDWNNFQVQDCYKTRENLGGWYCVNRGGYSVFGKTLEEAKRKAEQSRSIGRQEGMPMAAKKMDSKTANF
jgi:hypothetical protein